MAAIDTATMTNADIASALKTCDAEHLKVAETSTKLMLGVLLLPALGVCCLLMPVAPVVAVGGLVTGFLGALACLAGSEAYNIRALALEKDIETLGDESARRRYADAKPPELTAALSSQLSPSFDAAQRGLGEDIPVSKSAPFRAPKPGAGEG